MDEHLSVARCWSHLSLLYRGKWVNVSPWTLLTIFMISLDSVGPRPTELDGNWTVTLSMILVV